MTEQLLVHTGRHGYVIVDLQTGATISTLKGCSGRKYSSSFVGSSPFSHLVLNTNYYAVADASRSFVHFFRIDKPDSPCQSHAVPEKLPAICFTPCGSLCIAGGDVGNLYIWDLSSGGLLRCWRPHYKSVTAIFISPCGGYLFSSGEDSLVFCYSLAAVLDARGAKANEDPPCLHRWSTHRGPITAMSLGCLTPTETLLLTGSADRVVHVWSTNSASPVATYFLPAEVRHLTTNPTSMVAYVCCSDGKIYVLNLGCLIDPARNRFPNRVSSPVDISLSPVPLFVGHAGSVDCCAVNSDGTILVSCSSDGIRIWDCLSRETTKRLPSVGDTIVAVSIFRHDIGVNNRHGKSRNNQSMIFESVQCSRIPLPICKAFQRTWTNVLQPPTIVIPSKEPEYYRSLWEYYGPSLSAISRDMDSVSEIEIKSCEWMLNCADSIEASSLGRNVMLLKKDQKRFADAVCDVFDTLCELSSVPETRDKDHCSNQDDIYYTNQLPVTPIPAYSISTGVPSILTSHHTTTIPSLGSSRLFRYVDRTFAGSRPKLESKIKKVKRRRSPSLDAGIDKTKLVNDNQELVDQPIYDSISNAQTTDEEGMSDGSDQTSGTDRKKLKKNRNEESDNSEVGNSGCVEALTAAKIKEWTDEAMTSEEQGKHSGINQMEDQQMEINENNIDQRFTSDGRPMRKVKECLLSTGDESSDVYSDLSPHKNFNNHCSNTPSTAIQTDEANHCLKETSIDHPISGIRLSSNRQIQSSAVSCHSPQMAPYPLSRRLGRIRRLSEALRRRR